MYDIRSWCSFILLHVDCPVFWTPFIEETTPLYVLVNELPIHVWVYFGLSVLFHWCASVFVPVSACFYYSYFVVQFEIRECMPPGFFLLSEDCFGALGSFFVVPNYFRIIFLFLEIYHWNFYWDCIESVNSWPWLFDLLLATMILITILLPYLFLLLF